MIRRLELTIKTKLGLLATTLINTVLFFALVTTGQANLALEASSPSQISSSGIVQNGLVYHVDITNPSSYTGAGSSITDLTNNTQYNGIYGTPTLENSNRFLAFDGTTSDYFFSRDLSSDLSSISGSRRNDDERDITLELWVHLQQTSGVILSEHGSASLLSDWRTTFMEYDATAGILYADVWSLSAPDRLSTNIPNNSIVHLVLSVDTKGTTSTTDDVMSLFVNGELRDSGLKVRTIPNDITHAPGIFYALFGTSSTHMVTSSHLDAAFSQFRVYDRALTEGEVFSNFVYSASQLFTAEIGAPDSIEVSSIFNTIQVDWSAPVLATDTITGYQIEYKRVSDGQWTIAASVNDSALRTFTIINLEEQEDYFVRVAAKSDSAVGLYGYPWEKLFETTNPRRNAINLGQIVYESGFGLGENDAYIQFSGVEFSRVRYYMSYNSSDNFVDADFNRDIDRKGFETRRLFDQTVNLQVPAYGSSSEFILKGDVSDLQFYSSGKLNRIERGLTGRLELWPYDYIKVQESQFTLGLNSNSIYDDNDIPSTSGGNGHGSFQLHEVSQGSGNTIFAWNHHRNNTNPEMGFGNSVGSTRDWTFSTDYNINANRSLEYFYLGIFINPAIRTSLAGEAYQIQLNLAGGTVETNPINYTSLDTFPITLPTPTRTDYTFLGWYATSNYDGSVISEIANASSGSFALYANWITGTSPTIIGAGNRTLFRQSNESILISGSTTSGIENPQITVSGVVDYNTVADYNIELVVTDDTGNFTTYPIVVSIVLPTITFISDGFANVVESVDSGVTLTSPSALTRDDYDFIGWFYDAEFTQPVSFDSDVMPASNITLYAKWVRNYTAFASQTVRVNTDAIATSGAAVVRVTIDPSNFAGNFNTYGLNDVFFTSGLNSLLAFKRVSYNDSTNVAVYDVLVPFVDVSNKSTAIRLRYGISDNFSSGYLANTVTATPTTAFVANVTGTTVPLRVAHTLIEENLTNFPVTIVLNTSNYNFTGFDAYKNSVHFILNDGTLLDFEVEYANEAQKLAIYHVRLPQVSSSVDNNFTMRYGGNQNFANGFQAKNVWQSSYVFVSHMGATLLDSTGNQTLTNNGTTSQRVGNSFVRSFDRSASNVITTAGAVPITATHTQLVRLMPLGQIGALNFEVYYPASNHNWNGNTSGYPNNAFQFDAIVNAPLHAQGVAPVGFTTFSQANGSTSVGTRNLLNWMTVGDLNHFLPNVTSRADDFAVRLRGFFIPKETGVYTFTIEGDDAVDLIMNGTVVAHHYGPHGTASLGSHTGTITLTAGVPVTFQVRQQERGGGEGLRLFWKRPTQLGGSTWYQYAEELASLDVSNRQDPLSTHGAENTGYGLFLQNGQWVYSNGIGTNYSNLTFGSVSFGSFQTIALSNGAAKTAFINGTSVASAAADAMVDGSRHLHIGTHASDNHFNGLISDVRLASVERTSAWIKAETLSMEGSLVAVLASVAPTVATSSISEVTTSTANVNATLVSDGNALIDEYGVVFSTSENPTISDAKVTGALPASLGAYEIQLTNLTQNTPYYVRAFARNFVATVYGQQFTFLTRPSAPAITSFVARNQEVELDYTFPTGTLTSVEYAIDGGEWTSAGSITGSLTLTGLTNDQSTTLRIRVLNGSVASAESAEITFTPLEVIPIANFTRQANQSVQLSIDAVNSGLAGFKRFEYRFDQGAWVAFTTPVTIPATTSGLEVRSLYQDDTVSAQVNVSFNTVTYVVSGLSTLDVLLLPTDTNYLLVDPILEPNQVFIGWFTDGTWGTKTTAVAHGSNTTVVTYSADVLAVPTLSFARNLQRDLLFTFETTDTTNNPTQWLRLEYSIDNGANWIPVTQTLTNEYWTSLGLAVIDVLVRPVYVGETPSDSVRTIRLLPVTYRNDTNNSIAFVEWVPQNFGQFRLNQAIPELESLIVILWYPTANRTPSAIDFVNVGASAVEVFGQFEVGVYETSSGLINVLNPFAFASSVDQAGRIRISSEQLSQGDRLFIRSSGVDTANGVISEASGIIFIGNGASKVKIGAIDSFFHGQDGRDLVINVDSLLFNGDFSQQLQGWIINEFPTANTKAGFFNFGQFNLTPEMFPISATPPNISYYNLNCTTSYNNSTQTWNYASNCDDARSYERGNWSSIINDNRLWFTTQVVTINNQNFIQLASNGWTRTRQSTFAGTNDFGTLFGPTISSVQTFSAAAGDNITFDWQAVSGGDAADVYGFVIDDSVMTNGLPRLIPVFYRRVPQGQNQSGTHVHTFTSADLPQASSSLRFFFVNGTFDQTGGGLFGATFRISDITLNSALKLNANAANAILAQLAVEVLTPNPETIYSFTFASETENNVLQSGVKSIFVKGVNTPLTHNDNVILQINPGANVIVDIDFLDDFSDPDSVLSFTANGLPAFLALSTSGQLSLSGVSALTSDFSAVYAFDVTADDSEYSITKTYTFIVNPLPEATFWSHRDDALYTIQPEWFHTIPEFGATSAANITVGTLPACISRTQLTLQINNCEEGTYVIPVQVTNGVITYNFSATLNVSVDTSPPVISGINSVTLTTADSVNLIIMDAVVTDNLDGASVIKQFYAGFQHLVAPSSSRLIAAADAYESVGLYDCDINTAICELFTPSQNPTIVNFANGNATSGFTMIATSGLTGLEFFLDNDPILGAIRFRSGNQAAANDPTAYYLFGQVSQTEWVLLTSGSTYLPEARLTAGSGIAVNALTSYPFYRIVFDGPSTDTWTIGDIEFYFINPNEFLADEAAAVTALANRIPIFVTYTATDEALNQSSGTIRYNIQNFTPIVNTAVVIEPTDAIAFVDYTLLYTDDLFIDTDLQELVIYSVTGLPPGLVFNPQTKTISGSPTLVAGLSVEPYTITLTATDTQGASVSRQHIITVYYVADIIFDSNFGSAVARQTRIISQPVLAFKPEDPTRYAYDFIAWFADSGLTQEYDWNGVMADTDITLYAKWIPVEYNIVYNLNGGVNGANPSTFNIEDDVTYLNPSRIGYDFDGWFTDATFTTQTLGLVVGSSEVQTIYAKWTPIIYTLTYLDVVTTDGLPATYTIESDNITLARPSRIGLIFSGWSNNGFLPQGSIGNRIYTASWIPRTYTLTLIADGRQVSRSSISFGESLASVSLGMPPSRVGYDTIGWNQELPSTMPANNITITAVYVIRSFNFTALDDEGNELASSTVNFNASVPYPSTPTKEGFTFVRWSTTPSTMPASDLSVSAIFEVAEYVVTFVDSEGNNLGTANVAFGATIALIEPPEKEGFVFVEWTGLPDSMPAAAVTVTAVYDEVVVEEEPETEETDEETDDEEDDETTDVSAPAVPTLPSRGAINPIIIPEVVLPPNPDPVITRVSVNGVDLDVSIIPGRPVGNLPQAVLPGYNFQGWMNAITGEMITSETVINNPDFVVLVPLFEKAPSLIDATRSVFQALLANPFTALTQTNDFTTRTDNIQSVRTDTASTPAPIPIQGNLQAVINQNGSVTIPLPNERTPITLRVRGLDALTTVVYYYIGEGAPEFDDPSWIAYSGQPFLSAKQGESVFMMVKDAYDTHQVSYLKPATFIENPERIPTSSVILSPDNTSLSNTQRHSFLTKIEYEDKMIDLFMFEPTAASDLEQVIVRYRANDHNKSLLINVEAMTWREEIVSMGSSLGVYLRSGDNLSFEVEYQFRGQESVVESFQLSFEGESIGVFLAVSPNAFLRAMLAVLIISTLIAPYFIKPTE